MKLKVGTGQRPRPKLSEMGKILLLLLLAVGIWAFGLSLRLWDLDLFLRPGKRALGPGCRPPGWILCLKLGFDFEAGIWGMKLRFGP